MCPQGKKHTRPGLARVQYAEAIDALGSRICRTSRLQRRLHRQQWSPADKTRDCVILGFQHLSDIASSIVAHRSDPPPPILKLNASGVSLDKNDHDRRKEHTFELRLIVRYARVGTGWRSWANKTTKIPIQNALGTMSPFAHSASQSFDVFVRGACIR